MKKFNVEIIEMLASSKIVTLEVPDDWTENDVKSKLNAYGVDMDAEGVEKKHEIKVHDPYPNDWEPKDVDLYGRGDMKFGEIYEVKPK